MDTERRAQFNFVNCAPPLQAYQFPAAEKDHLEAVLKLLFARRGSAEPAPSRRTISRAPTDIWTGRCYDSFGAKVRVGESISAQFGGAISLQDRSTFELRDYPRKETLVGTLCLRRGANPARVLLCRELAQRRPSPATGFRSAYRRIADLRDRMSVHRRICRFG